MKKEYNDLHELIMDPLFPEIDVKLRLGWHCDEEEIEAYEFITRALDWVTIYYDLYGSELVYAAEGYYYLRPVSKLIRTYTLGIESMIVSQFLALMKMDPRYLESSGSFDFQELVEKIELLLGKNQISRIFLKRKREKEMVGEHDIANFHQAIKKSLRELARLGFVSINPDFSRIYPRKPIFRFMDPVRNLEDPQKALESVVKGEDPFMTDSPDEVEEEDE
ncbi:MAG: hypothetical protein HN745_28830 [Deltaproteobacteria bacterium]|nr:hypothetical protein [Deltaproteobacteria bacterium]